MSLTRVKGVLLLFWALWHTAVTATNVIEVGRVYGRLRRAQAFASGNYALLCDVTAKHRLAEGPRRLLFGAGTLAEAIVAVLFWRAAVSSRSTLSGSQSSDTAIASALGLWGGFLIADEVLVAYKTGVEAAHLRLLIAQIATLIAMHWLPRPHGVAAAGGRRPSFLRNPPR